jgi:predicted dehydrogenase
MVIQEFIDHVTQGQQDNHTILNVIHRATVLEAIYESAKSGQEVKL